MDKDFDKYLNNHRYKFKNNTNEVGGYAIFKNKKHLFFMDIGNLHLKKNFQKITNLVLLSFEIILNDKKLFVILVIFKKSNIN